VEGVPDAGGGVVGLVAASGNGAGPMRCESERRLMANAQQAQLSAQSVQSAQQASSAGAGAGTAGGGESLSQVASVPATHASGVLEDVASNAQANAFCEVSNAANTSSPRKARPPRRR